MSAEINQKGDGKGIRVLNAVQRCAGLFVLALPLSCFLSAGAATAQLKVLEFSKPFAIFGNITSDIPLTIRWAIEPKETAPSTFEIRWRLFQASSSTTAPFDEHLWKAVQILPGQTVLESAPVAFPAVKAETRFLVQWLAEGDRIIGTTDVHVFPTDLLKGLKPLAADEPLGLFDPVNQLKPIARRLDLDFLDLEDTGLEKFRGKVAIVGPFASAGEMPSYISKSIRAAARSGAGIVWLQPPGSPAQRRKLIPSFYSLPVGHGNVVIVQAELVADLPNRPRSQLNLIHFARLAVRPEPLSLPRSESDENSNNL